jgi:hypothetical protein
MSGTNNLCFFSVQQHRLYSEGKETIRIMRKSINLCKLMSQTIQPNILWNGQIREFRQAHFREQTTWQRLPVALPTLSVSPGDRASHLITPPSGKLPCSAVNRQDKSHDTSHGL